MEETCEDTTLFKGLREKLDHFLEKFVERENNEELGQLLESQEWKNLSPIEYSYTVAPMIQSDPDYMQLLLESSSAEERLSLIHRILNL